jgi:hypothetical protein
VRFLLHRADPLLRELSQKEWQEPDILWLTGTHTAEHVRYFNQESHEELLWWIQVPSLVAASPAQQRSAAQESFRAVTAGADAAKDAGFRLDTLLATAAAPPAGQGAPTRKRKPATTGAAKASTRKETKSSSRKESTSSSKTDGTGQSVPEKAASVKKPKKQAMKKSTSSKRKP